MATFLDTILADAAVEREAARAKRPPAEIRRMLADAAPPRDFAGALSGAFGLIAELKQRSPSVGPMRSANVAAAPAAYESSPVVHAISVLTNATHFGQDITTLATVAAGSSKPVLRKDFLVEEYQVREARAFGADAILLMATVLDAPRLRGFYDLARELGMQALFEVHEADEIAALPSDAAVIGINSRKFKQSQGFVGATGHAETDLTVDFQAFTLAGKLPANALKVAESGLTPQTIAAARGPFHAALVGAALLRDPRGTAACLQDFERAMAHQSPSENRLERTGTHTDLF